MRLRLRADPEGVRREDARRDRLAPPDQVGGAFERAHAIRQALADVRRDLGHAADEDEPADALAATPPTLRAPGSCPSSGRGGRAVWRRARRRARRVRRPRCPWKSRQESPGDRPTRRGSRVGAARPARGRSTRPRRVRAARGRPGPVPVSSTFIVGVRHVNRESRGFGLRPRATARFTIHCLTPSWTSTHDSGLAPTASAPAGRRRRRGRTPGARARWATTPGGRR